MMVKMIITSHIKQKRARYNNIVKTLQRYTITQICFTGVYWICGCKIQH